MARGGIRAWACTGVGTSVSVGGGIYAEGFMAGVFVGRELLSRGFTANEGCSQHPHICDCA